MAGKSTEVQTSDSKEPLEARTADVRHKAVSGKRATDQSPEPSNAERVADQKAWEKSNGSDPVSDEDHASVEPTEADYEKARTVGIGNEPELPPGVVRGH